jgi:hypothetical protein
MLDRRDREVPSTRTVGRPNSSIDVTLNSAFFPVYVVEVAVEPVAVTAPIEIVLPASPTVRFVRGCDPIALDAVLSVLAAR